MAQTIHEPKPPFPEQHQVDHAVATFGKLDILVNNAAFQNSQEHIADITDEQFERTMRTNIFGISTWPVRRCGTSVKRVERKIRVNCVAPAG